MNLHFKNEVRFRGMIIAAASGLLKNDSIYKMIER